MVTVLVVVAAIVVLAWVIYKNAYRSDLPLATPKTDPSNHYLPPDMAYWHRPSKK